MAIILISRVAATYFADNIPEYRSSRCRYSLVTALRDGTVVGADGVPEWAVEGDDEVRETF